MNAMFDDAVNGECNSWRRSEEGTLKQVVSTYSDNQLSLFHALQLYIAPSLSIALLVPNIVNHRLHVCLPSTSVGWLGWYGMECGDCETQPQEIAWARPRPVSASVNILAKLTIFQM